MKNIIIALLVTGLLGSPLCAATKTVVKPVITDVKAARMAKKSPTYKNVVEASKAQSAAFVAKRKAARTAAAKKAK